MNKNLILDDLVGFHSRDLLNEKDYMYPESLKEINPVYAMHLVSIGAKFYKENGATRYIDRNGDAQIMHHISVGMRMYEKE